MVGAQQHFRSQAGPPSGLEARAMPTPPLASVSRAGAAAVLYRSSRPHFQTRTDGKPFTASRPVSLIQARHDQAVCFSPVSLRARGEVFSIFTSNPADEAFALHGPANPPQRFLKQGVGGFHGVSLMQLRQTSPLEAL